MAISKPPVKKPIGTTLPAVTPNEEKIEAVINRGSTIVNSDPASKQESEPERIKNFNIRITSSMLQEIDALRAKRPRKPTSPKLGVSTQDWLLEAVQEKLQRDKKKYK